MGQRRGLKGFAWLCGAQHFNDSQQQPPPHSPDEASDLRKQQQAQQSRTPGSPTPLQPAQTKAAAATDRCNSGAGNGGGSSCHPDGGRESNSTGVGSSSTRTSAAAAAATAGGKTGSSAFARAGSAAAAAAAGVGVRTFSLREDSASFSSVPASEAVFGLASRASAPAAPLGSLGLGGGGGGGDTVSVDGRSSGGFILRPITDGALPPSAGTRSGGSRRRFKPVKSVPNLSKTVTTAPGVGAAGQPPPPPSSPPPPGSTASAALPMSPPSSGLHREPSLSAASERSYGSSLLLAAFDRHDSRRVFVTDSAMGDTASSGSGTSSPATALRRPLGHYDRNAAFAAQASRSASMPSLLVGSGAATAAASATATATPTANGSANAAQAGAAADGGGSGTEAAALGTARGFCEAFLRALASGDSRWGSDPRVGSLFAETARMLTHDGQLFVGRTAIIRRLNAGMEQLHKMLGAMPNGGGNGDAAAVDSGGDGDGDGDAEGGRAARGAPLSAAAQKLADKVTHTLDIQLVSRAAPDAKKHGGTKGAKSGILRRFLSMGSAGGVSMAAAAADAATSEAVAAAAAGGKAPRTPRILSRTGSMSSFSGAAGAGSGGGGGGGGSVRVVATYNFRYGLRRFRLQDHFAVRGGVIVRLKRTRG